jgi:hypothetical protein
MRLTVILLAILPVLALAQDSASDSAATATER